VRCPATGRSDETTAIAWGVEPVDQLGELVCRGLKAERLSRPAVELLGDLVEALLVDPGETLSPWEVLAKETAIVACSIALTGQLLNHAAKIRELDGTGPVR
jgi:hypothetical protein